MLLMRVYWIWLIKNLKSLEVEIIQFPNKENNMTAICTAKATTEDEVYIDIGDASPPVC